MGTLHSLWHGASPYTRAIVAGITGAIVIVFAPVIFAQLTAFAIGGTAKWPETAILWRTFLFAALVVGVAYWARSPKGREVWTDEQRQALRDTLKDRQL